jgi:hypothetical protein
MIMPTHSGQSGDLEELRAFVCRAILAEDSRWAMDVILSTGRVDHLSGYVPLVVGHHFIRIAYEGAIAVQSGNPRVGIPELARLLQPEYETITARARHLTKLLDNTKKSYAEVLTDLASELKVHHESLTGNSMRAVRWLEKDLGLYYLDRAAIGATTPIAYRLGLHPTRSQSISNADLLAVAEEWGRTLVILGAAALDPNEPTSTLELSDIRIGHRDRLASRYLSTRFDPQFSPELKALVLLIEGDLNTSRLLLPRTSLGHEGAVFRAQVVTAYHCLSALQQICDAFAARDTGGLRRLRSLLSDEPTQRLLSPGGTKVRNRSVHYEMNDPTIIPDLARPMYGLVEAVYPGRTWETFDTDIREVTSRAAECLADWSPP